MDLIEKIRQIFSAESKSIVQDEDGNVLSKADMARRSYAGSNDNIEFIKEEIERTKKEFNEIDFEFELKLRACKEAIQKSQDETVKNNEKHIIDRRERTQEKYINKISALVNELEKSEKDLEKSLDRLEKAIKETGDFEYKKYMHKCLGRKRESMPQISKEDMDKILIHFSGISNGSKVYKTKIQLGKLRPSQLEINEDRVIKMVKENHIPDHFIVGKKNYLLDGHHGWSSALEQLDPETEVTVYKIMLKPEEALRRINLLRTTSKEDIEGNEIQKAVELVALATEEQQESVSKIMKSYAEGTLEGEWISKAQVINFAIQESKIEKAAGHKYIRKEPNGRGGWNYIYQDDDAKSKAEGDISKEQRDRNFKEWFGESVVTNERGEPLTVYHASKNDFGVFKESDKEVGIHFGDIVHANYISNEKSADIYYKAYLKIEKPIELVDEGYWDAETIVSQLRYGIHNFSKNDLLEMKSIIVDEDLSDFEKNVAIKGYLIEAGYDGIVYKNLFEDEEVRKIKRLRKELSLKYYSEKDSVKKKEIEKELTSLKEKLNSTSKYSFAVFNSNQIKSATGNVGTFDSNSNDITKSDTIEKAKKVKNLEKSAGHKYLRKEPDGKGGWNYIYKDVKGKEETKEENSPKDFSKISEKKYNEIKDNSPLKSGESYFIRYTSNPELDLKRGTSIHESDYNSVAEAEENDPDSEWIELDGGGIGQLIGGLAGFEHTVDEDESQELDNVLELAEETVDSYLKNGSPNTHIDKDRIPVLYKGKYRNGIPDGDVFEPISIVKYLGRKHIEAIDIIEKGKKAAMGETRTWHGVKMQKTPTGWVPVKGDKKGKGKDEEKGSIQHSPEQIQKYAQRASTDQLKEAIKDESKSKHLVDAAKRELENREPEAEKAKKDEENKETKSANKADNKDDKKNIANKIKDKAKNWHDKQKEMYKHGHHVAHSEERKILSSFLRKKAKGIVTGLKHEYHEFKEAASGLKKFFTGNRKEITKEEAKAMKGIGTHLAITVGMMALTGGIGAGLKSGIHILGKHIALHYLEHAGITRLAHAALFASIQHDIMKAKEEGKELSDEEVVKLLIDKMIEYMESGEISEEDWAEMSEKANGDFEDIYDGEEDEDQIEKAAGHKYIRKEPNGKGGFNYIYDEPENKEKKEDGNSEDVDLKENTSNDDVDILKSAVSANTEVLIGGEKGRVESSEAEGSQIKYKVITERGGTIEVLEKNVEILPNLNSKEVADKLNSLTPESRIKASKEIFGKGVEMEKEIKAREIVKKQFTTPSGETIEALDLTSVAPQDIGWPDIDGILEKERPYYFPEINEEWFGRGSTNSKFLFDYVKIGNDQYLVFLNGASDMGYFKNDNVANAEAIMSLDNLVAMTEYYRLKHKAKLQAKADEKNKRQEEYWDKQAPEVKEKYLGKLPHSALPAKVRKQVSKEDWDIMPVSEREMLYKPIKTFGPEKMTYDDPITRPIRKDNFYLHKKFVNKDYQMPTGGRYVSDDPAAKEYNKVSEYLKFKRIDMRISSEEQSEAYKKARNTSFGDTNLNDALSNDFGVKIKSQDGKNMSIQQVEQIKDALTDVYSSFGNRSEMAKNFGLKISHAGEKRMFASQAVGLYVPSERTIGVSAHYGEPNFGFTLAHEFSHFIDNYLGSKMGRKFASDDYDSTAGQIAFAFRDNMNASSSSDYVNRTCECFARALEQYHAMSKTGNDAQIVSKKYVDHKNYVNLNTFNQKIKPLIEKFITDNDSLLKGLQLEFNNSEDWAIDILEKAGFGDIVEKSGYKYIRREPNGKGGFNYIYEESREKKDKEIPKEELNEVVDYTDSGYLTLNKNLRSGKEDPREAILNNALAKLKSIPGVSYRAISPIKSLEEHFSDYESSKGSEIQYAAFLSTTTSKNVVNNFGNEIFYTINGKNGKDVADLSTSPGENELLFASKTKFLVKSVKGIKSKNGKLIRIEIKLEEK